jgi:hypothetical protein
MIISKRSEVINMKQYKIDRLENKYCYGSHSKQARINITRHRVYGTDPYKNCWNQTVRKRIAKKIYRLKKLDN